MCKSAAAFVAHHANRHAALQLRGIEVSAEVDIFRYGGVVVAYFLCYVKFISLYHMLELRRSNLEVLQAFSGRN